MGEHWANPNELPNGPIYGVYNGKLIFLEYMIAQDDFIERESSYTNLGWNEGSSITFCCPKQISNFESHGHPGFEIPHYDIHAYFISDEEQHKIATTYLELKDNKGEKIGFAAFVQMGEAAIC